MTVVRTVLLAGLALQRLFQPVRTAAADATPAKDGDPISSLQRDSTYFSSSIARAAINPPSSRATTS